MRFSTACRRRAVVAWGAERGYRTDVRVVDAENVTSGAAVAPGALLPSQS